MKTKNKEFIAEYFELCKKHKKYIVGEDIKIVEMEDDEIGELFLYNNINKLLMSEN